MSTINKFITVTFTVLSLTVLLLFPFCGSNDWNSIRKEFKNVPNTKLAVYWYWISDNISKDAVIKDLEAMKEQGIDRAFIGNIGVDGVPYGDVKMLSDEWWDILHTALKKATELGIEIGIFNSPGWSQSGGPWIKPENSMRYLKADTILIEGGEKIEVTLPEINSDEEEYKVLAFPNLKGNLIKSCQISGNELLFKTDESINSRTIVIENKEVPYRASAVLYVKENDTYTTVKNIDIDRSNPQLHVGFAPFSPIVVSLPSVKGKEFVLKFSCDIKDYISNAYITDIPQIERYPEKTFAKMHQTPLPMWNEYMWEQQKPVNDSTVMINQSTVFDITDFVKDNVLSWDAPKGKWTIMRFTMCPTGVTNSPASPETTGLEVDKLSKEHVRHHFDSFIGEILRRIPSEDRKSFKVVVMDSYETGGQNWTDNMESEFERRYGYNPVPYLPALHGYVIGSLDESDRFLWDLRRLVADLVAENYIGGLKEICNEHGLTTWLENYGHWGFPSEFLKYGSFSDEIGGEFWSEGTLGDIENRAASSCAHIYGKELVWAESFTSGGPEFSRSPFDMKLRGDRFFTEGINASLLHVYILQADKENRVPGINAWFGNEFNRNNTWYSSLSLFTDYLKRCNFMLRQGHYVADIAYFIGEDAPKMTGICVPEIPKGYSFDYINSDVLLNKARVKDGELILESGMRYKILVLPMVDSMRPELILKIKDFVEQGLVVVGECKPTRSPSLSGYPISDTIVNKISNELWTDNSCNEILQCGKNRVLMDTTLIEVLNKINLSPDFKCSDESIDVRYLHRRINSGEIYFISNQTKEFISSEFSFRVNGLYPEMWNPVSGEIRPLNEYSEKGDYITVPLELHENESCFVVFTNGKGKDSKDFLRNFPEKEILKTIENSWDVRFVNSSLGIDKKYTFNNLIDWTKHSDNDVRYFSGLARYSTEFCLENISDNKSIYLDLGKLSSMAKIWINDKYAGGVWTYPYRLKVNDFLRLGQNTLTIEVVNNWNNRLIGDEVTDTINNSSVKTWIPVKTLKSDSPLQSSGLLGPVEIIAYEY